MKEIRGLGSMVGDGRVKTRYWQSHTTPPQLASSTFIFTIEIIIAPLIDQLQPENSH